MRKVFRSLIGACLLLGGVAFGVRAESLPCLDDLLIYQIALACDGGQTDQVVAQCLAREIPVTKQAEGILVSSRFLDYKTAKQLRNRFLQMGLKAELQITTEPYEKLLQSKEFPQEDFATFTDLESPPATFPDEAIYQNFLNVSEQSGVTRPERIEAIAPYVDALRFRKNDGYAQYLTGMYHL